MVAAIYQERADFHPPVFIGRSDGCRHSIKRWRGSSAARPGVVWIEGPSGIGKTALLEQLRRNFTAAGRVSSL